MQTQSGKDTSKVQGQTETQGNKNITGTPDEHYNVVSVLYHALQGCETCGQYERDAQQAGDQELAGFFRETQDQLKRIAEKGKRLLAKKIGTGQGTA